MNGVMRSDCPIPELPTLGCLVPPSATPTPSPSPTPTVSVTPTPAPEVTPTAVFSPAPVVAPVPAPAAVTGPIALPSAPPAAVPVVASTTASPSPTPVALDSGVPLSSVVPSAYAIVVFGLIGTALLLSFLSGLRPSVGGIMKTTRTRLWAGLLTLAVAAVVGGVGWYRISGEPLLNRQVPFLASAGIAVVVLAVLGGALIVAEQLRADQNRIGDLEDAVRALTEALAPVVEAAPRR